MLGHASTVAYKLPGVNRGPTPRSDLALRLTTRCHPTASAALPLNRDGTTWPNGLRRWLRHRLMGGVSRTESSATWSTAEEYAQFALMLGAGGQWNGKRLQR